MLCGWNVSVRGLANILALSSSECTQFPLVSRKVAGGLRIRRSRFVINLLLCYCMTYDKIPSYYFFNKKFKVIYRRVDFLT